MSFSDKTVVKTHDQKVFKMYRDGTIHVTGEIWGQQKLMTYNHVALLTIKNLDTHEVVYEVDYRGTAGKFGVTTLTIDKKLQVKSGNYAASITARIGEEISEVAGGLIIIETFSSYDSPSPSPGTPAETIEKIKNSVMDFKIGKVPVILLVPVPMLLLLILKKGRKK